MKRSYHKTRLSGVDWEELGQSSNDRRTTMRHELSNAKLVKLIPQPLLQKYCDLIRANTVSETDDRSPYKDEPPKGCRILVKARAQTKVHFKMAGVEYNFTVDDKHLLYFEAKGEAVDYPCVEVSHDCHRDKEYECSEVDHFMLEDNATNNRRNGCSIASYCENCCMVTYGGTRCHEGKHGEDTKMCRTPVLLCKPPPRSNEAKRCRLETLRVTRSVIDEQIAQLEGKGNDDDDEFV